MATNFIQEGDILDLLAPYDRTSGQGMQVGQIFAVALGTALSAAAIRGKTSGVWLLTKVGSQAWAVGDKVYWDDGNKRCTTVATAGMLIGVATTIAGSGSTVVTGYVRLNGVAPAALEGPQAAEADITDNSGGASADGTIAVVTAPTALTGTLTGTVNSALVDIAATAGSCAGTSTPSATNVDSAIATAVASIVTGTNEQLKELQTAIGQDRTAIIALTDAVKELSTKQNALLAKLRIVGIIAP